MSPDIVVVIFQQGDQRIDSPGVTELPKSFRGSLPDPLVVGGEGLDQGIHCPVVPKLSERPGGYELDRG